MNLEYITLHWDTLTEELNGPKEQFFQEILTRYTHKERAYHTLAHIQSLLKFFDVHRVSLEQPVAIQFAIWYHDIVYKVHRKDNEKRSAKIARARLHTLEVEESTIALTHSLIVATRDHTIPDQRDSFDFRFLLDIDLSILASEKAQYGEYVQQIREEYRIYPDFLYKKGRKSVLLHFLQKKRIYQTELFHSMWEERARENLQVELDTL
ncbi:MAG: hypothetical protein AAGA10_11385 [Bacteroidota bacterium]